MSYSILEKKETVSITPEHFVEIPETFYSQFNFSDKAEFFISDGNLVLRPVPTMKNPLLKELQEIREKYADSVKDDIGFDDVLENIKELNKNEKIKTVSEIWGE